LAPATGAPAQTNTGTEPSIGIRLLQAPVALQNDPRAKTYIIDHVAPGVTLTRTIGVTSTSASPVQVQLYSGAATVNGGSFNPGPADQPNDLTSWITVTPKSVVVPPHGEATATVTIVVPQSAGPGERYGVVWAQPPPNSSGSGITVVNRVGIRVYLSVGDGAAPTIDFTINSLTAARDQSGRPYVTASVHNTGGRALDLSGSLTLGNGPGGTRAGPFAAKLGTTLGIGQTEPVTILLDRSLPEGPWLADLTLTSDAVVREATATITFPASSGQTSGAVLAKPVHHHRNASFLAVTGIAVIVLAAVGLLLFLFWRRRREDESDGSYGETPVLGRSN
jgi:hypothetical protein